MLKGIMDHQGRGDQRDLVDEIGDEPGTEMALSMSCPLFLRVVAPGKTSSRKQDL